MKILIVGGTHRTGPYLVEELLDRGHEVILYHRGVHERHFSGPVTHIHGDRRDYSSFKQQMADVEVDAVVDMSLYYPEDSQAVVDAFQGRIKRSVHISSYDVYAIWAMWTHKTKRPSPIFPVPIPEDAPLRTELYPHKHQFQGKITKLDKLLCEHVIQAARKHSFPATVLRWPAIYGPGDPRTREWYIVKHILDGCAEIALPGRGLAMLHRGYFKNLAHSIALALENDDADGKIYNVGDEQVPTLWQLTQMIAEIMGSSIEIVPVPGDLLPRWNPFDVEPHIVLDLTKIKTELGYHDLVEIGEALEKTVQWLVDNPPAESWFEFDYDHEKEVIAQARNM